MSAFVPPSRQTEATAKSRGGGSLTNKSESVRILAENNNNLESRSKGSAKGSPKGSARGSQRPSSPASPLGTARSISEYHAEVGNELTRPEGMLDRDHVLGLSRDSIY